MTPPSRRISDIAGQILRGVAAASMALACLSLAALVLLFLVVIGSRMIGMAVPSADDVAVIILGGTLSLGFASAVPHDQHISVDFFRDFAGARPAAALTVFGYLVTIAVVGYLLVGLFHIWDAAFRSGITMLGSLPIPRAVPMGIVLAGVALLELALVLRFIERAFGIGFGPDPGRRPEGAGE